MSRRLDVVCYFHEPVKGPLLRDAALPAVRFAAQLGVEAHLERHWLHGPHVKLCLAGPKQTVSDVAEEIAGRWRGYLARHPSTARIDPDELLIQVESAGRAELIPPPYQPIHPDNTVRVVPADDTPLRALLGSTPALAHRRRLLSEGMPVVAASIEALAATPASAGARVGLTLAAMAGHATRYPIGLIGGYHSFLSHVEDHLQFHDPAGTLRASYAAQWTRHGDRVTDLVARIAERRTTTRAEAAWGDWSDTARALLEPAYDRGDLPVPGPEYAERARAVGDPGTARRWDPAQRTEYSDYHRMWQKVGYGFSSDRSFLVYRFATNVLYLLLGLCDVRPAERYLAASLFSRAAERITGVTWQERLAQLAAGGQP